MEDLKLNSYLGVQIFKSVRRAIRRGHVSPTGAVYPQRPYNNRKSSPGRKFQDDKRATLARLKEYGRKH
jgi:hypothetical protein